MARRTQRPIEAPQSPPPAGHNSVLTDNDLIAENFRLEDQIKAAQAKLAEWVAPLNTRLKEIESEVSRRLLERGADSTKTDSGTAYFSNILNTNIEDRTAIIDFMMDNWDQSDWGGDTMMQVNVTKDAVKKYMEAHNGAQPPGVSISYFQRLNIKRS